MKRFRTTEGIRSLACERTLWYSLQSLSVCLSQPGLDRQRDRKKKKKRGFRINVRPSIITFLFARHRKVVVSGPFPSPPLPSPARRSSILTFYKYKYCQVNVLTVKHSWEGNKECQHCCQIIHDKFENPRVSPIYCLHNSHLGEPYLDITATDSEAVNTCR